MALNMKKKPQIGEHTEVNFILPTSFSWSIHPLLYELNARACNVSGKLADDFEKLSSLETLNLGHNSFRCLPASQELLLPHCRKLKTLPPLPSTFITSWCFLWLSWLCVWVWNMTVLKSILGSRSQKNHNSTFVRSKFKPPPWIAASWAGFFFGLVLFFAFLFICSVGSLFVRFCSNK